MFSATAKIRLIETKEIIVSLIEIRNNQREFISKNQETRFVARSLYDGAIKLYLAKYSNSKDESFSINSDLFFLYP